MANADENLTREVMAKVEELAKRGYRTLGVAVDLGDGWKFAGLIPLFDPPRDDSAETVKFLRRNGIRVKMITGDHIAIGKEIAKILSIGTRYTLQMSSKMPRSTDSYSSVRRLMALPRYTPSTSSG